MQTIFDGIGVTRVYAVIYHGDVNEISLKLVRSIMMLTTCGFCDGKGSSYLHEEDKVRSS